MAIALDLKSIKIKINAWKKFFSKSVIILPGWRNQPKADKLVDLIAYGDRTGLKIQ
jgi:hypothetical protein